MWGWDARHRGAGQEVREGGLYSLQSTTQLAYTPASAAIHCSTTPHHTPLQVTREADKVTTQQSTGQQLVCLWVLKVPTGAPHHITSLVPTCVCTCAHRSTLPQAVNLLLPLLLQLPLQPPWRRGGRVRPWRASPQHVEGGRGPGGGCPPIPWMGGRAHVEWWWHHCC